MSRIAQSWTRVSKQLAVTQYRDRKFRTLTVRIVNGERTVSVVTRFGKVYRCGVA